jgi:hypothetical protein
MFLEAAAVAVGEEAELVLTIRVNELRMLALGAEHDELVDRRLHAANVRNLGEGDIRRTATSHPGRKANGSRPLAAPTEQTLP